MNDFEKKIAGGLGTWSVGSLFLIAVSGGADSTALLSAMAVIARERGFRLRCLHVDHGIRAEAERQGDAEAVERLCVRLDVPCTVTIIPPGTVEQTAKERGIGIEAAARLFRHRAWKKELARIGAERILVAHTEDDLLETILMRFLRGSGSAGLAGMKREQYPVLRPMLFIPRADALRYLEERVIPFRTDSTNSDIHYMRNRIRLKLIPILDEFFSEPTVTWRKNVLAGAETQRYVADFLEEEASAHITWTDEMDGNRKKMSTTAVFFSIPEIVREEALFKAIDRINQADDASVPPKRSALRLFCRGCKNAVETGRVRISKEKDKVVIAKQQEFSETGFALFIRDGIDTSEEHVCDLQRGMLIKKNGSYIIGKEEKIKVSEESFPAVIHSTDSGKITVDYSGGSNG
ncbi:MAG: tRNA lysidine(34) synthetase TilS [Treponema sp.]|jgi:tRNA(Ile)-lysidine synthase|nr:tRNA lysidine(34) synthetase TilS [Treponema sp.]